jgi:hypothetical protein
VDKAYWIISRTSFYLDYSSESLVLYLYFYLSQKGDVLPGKKKLC